MSLARCIKHKIWQESLRVKWVVIVMFLREFDNPCQLLLRSEWLWSHNRNLVSSSFFIDLPWYKATRHWRPGLICTWGKEKCNKKRKKLRLNYFWLKLLWKMMNKRWPIPLKHPNFIKLIFFIVHHLYIYIYIL